MNVILVFMYLISIGPVVTEYFSMPFFALIYINCNEQYHQIAKILHWVTGQIQTTLQIVLFLRRQTQN